MEAQEVMKPKTVDQLNPEEFANLACILDRAKLGDQTALAELTNALNDYPEISARYGDLGLQALESWVQLIAGKNLLLHESLNRKLDEMRAELTGGKDASLLEKLMVEQILSTWLQARHIDALISQGQSPLTVYQLDKRQTGAHQRFLKSVQALANLRKLLRPIASPVQIATRLDKVKNNPVQRRSTPLAAGVPTNN
jgi:hypothetical protein